MLELVITASMLTVMPNQYAWQNMSRFYNTALVSRAGHVRELDLNLDDGVGTIQINFLDGTQSSVDEFVDSNPVEGAVSIEWREGVVDIADTGPGIPGQDLGRVTDRQLQWG